MTEEYVEPVAEHIEPAPAVQKCFSIYEASSGRIVAALTVLSDEERDANMADGQGWIEGYFDPATFYVADGQATAYPPQPEEWMTFDYALGEWIDDRGAEDLEALRAVVLDQLNRYVANQRRQFITDLPGQEMIYLRKEDEGRRYLASEVEPVDLSDFPLIAAEVGITAPTAYQLATIWVQLTSMWIGAAAQIEQFRMTVDARIRASVSFVELETIRGELTL